MFAGFNVPLAIMAIIAVNLTMFAVVLQLDLLVFHSDIAKVLAWAAAVGCWHMAYQFRNFRS